LASASNQYIVTVLLVTKSNHLFWQHCWLLWALIYCDTPVGFWKKLCIV